MGWTLDDFYDRLGLSDPLEFRRAVFRVAYFWRMSPHELMATDLNLLAVLFEEMVHIKEDMNGDA